MKTSNATSRLLVLVAAVLIAPQVGCRRASEPAQPARTEPTPPSLEPDIRWSTVEAAPAEKALTKCGESVKLAHKAFMEENGPPDLVDDFEIRRKGSWMAWTVAMVGSGLDGTSERHTFLVDQSTCELGQVNEFYENSSLWLSDVSSNDEPPDAALLTVLEGHVVESFNPASPKHSLAAMLRSFERPEEGYPELGNCLPGRTRSKQRFQLSAPLAPAQPWHAGPPVAQASVLDGRTLYAAAEAPKPTLETDRWRLSSVNLPSRYQGQAVAVYDTERKRHRWLFATVSCALGHIEWQGAQEGLLFGTARTEHSVYLPSVLFVDLKSLEARVLLSRDGRPSERLPCQPQRDEGSKRKSCVNPNDVRMALQPD